MAKKLQEIYRHTYRHTYRLPLVVLSAALQQKIVNKNLFENAQLINAVCPIDLAHLYIEPWYIKLGKSSWTHGMH